MRRAIAAEVVDRLMRSILLRDSLEGSKSPHNDDPRQRELHPLAGSACPRLSPLAQGLTSHDSTTGSSPRCHRNQIRSFMRICVLGSTTQSHDAMPEQLNYVRVQR